MALNFPSSPADGDIYDNFVWDATSEVWRPNRGTLASLNDVSLTSLAEGDHLYYSGGTWVNGATGYYLKETLFYTASSTFTKASYPWLRAITVKMQGAGGGGGGATTTAAGQTAVGGAGGAGAYAEFFLTNAYSGLPSSATITIGAAGTGATAGANAGNTGGSTTFDIFTVGGGSGGAGGSASNTNRVIAGASGSSTFTNIPSDALTIEGGSGQPVWSLGATTPGTVMRGFGGRSLLSSGALASTTTTGVAGASATSTGTGGGGSGGMNAQSQATARAGGAGSAGIVILELWA